MDFLDRELTSGDFARVAAMIGAGSDLSSGQYGPYSVRDTGHGTRVVSYAGGGGGGGGMPGFNFDWAQAENEALAKLTPYYEQKLAEAQGDVDRAKRLIEEDYQRGKRYREEDLQTQTAADTRQAKDEREAAIEDLNRRGLLFGEIPTAGQSQAPYSQFAQNQVLQPLDEKQAARQMAIRRAISRQEEAAGVERTRGIEEQNIQFPRYKKALEEEKKEKAVLQMAPLKYQQEYTKYQATAGRAVNNPYIQG